MADREPKPPDAATDDPEDERLEGLRRYDVRTVPPGARLAWLATKTPTVPPEQLTDTVPPGQKKAETVPYGMTPSEPQPQPPSPEPLPAVVLSESVLNQKRPRYPAELAQTVILPRRLEQQRARRTRLVAGLAVAALLVVIAAVARLRAPSTPTEASPVAPAPTTSAEAPPAPTSEPVIPTNAAAAVPSAPRAAAAAPAKTFKAPKPETPPPAAAPPPPQPPPPVKKSGDGIFDKPLAPPAD